MKGNENGTTRECERGEACKKSYCKFVYVTLSGLTAFVLIIVGLSVNTWWHAPSMVEVQRPNDRSPIGKFTTYQLRGLWNYDSDTITKYKWKRIIIKVDNFPLVVYVRHVRSDVPGWYKAVIAFETIGCILTFVSLAFSVGWALNYWRCSKQCKCLEKINLTTYISAGIAIFLGILILFSKTELDRIAWAPSVAGVGGAFCIIAASFIRWYLQDDFNGES